MVAGEVLELCVQIALGNQVASVSPRCGVVCQSSHLRIPNDLVSPTPPFRLLIFYKFFLVFLPPPYPFLK